MCVVCFQRELMRCKQEARNLQAVKVRPHIYHYTLLTHTHSMHRHIHTHKYTHTETWLFHHLIMTAFFSICAEEMLSSPSYPCVLLTGGWNRMQRAVHRAATLGRGLLNSFMFLWSGY